MNIEIKHGVQIQISHNAKFIWINVDGICQLRLHNSNNYPIEIEDNRTRDAK
jgi:hypothetical protein